MTNRWPGAPADQKSCTGPSNGKEENLFRRDDWPVASPIPIIVPFSVESVERGTTTATTTTISMQIKSPTRLAAFMCRLGKRETATRTVQDANKRRRFIPRRTRVRIKRKRKEQSVESSDKKERRTKTAVKGFFFFFRAANERGALSVLPAGRPVVLSLHRETIGPIKGRKNRV